MVKAIIFDADGVMVNAEMFSVQLERDFGITKNKVLPFFTGEFQDCLIGKKDLKETIAKHLPEWGWKGSVDDLLAYWFRSEHNINEPLVEEIKELRAQGVRCYLATNQEKYRTEYMLEQMGFNNIFDGIFSSAFIGHKKPEKEFFEKVMEQLPGVKRDEVWFWDDTQGHIDAANAFGWHAYFYESLDQFKEIMTKVIKKAE